MTGLFGAGDHSASGAVRGVNTDIITQAGIDKGYEHLKDMVPDTHPMIAELVLNMFRSDWSAGNEDRAMKDLMQIVDLTGAYRLVAVMVTASKVSP